MRHAKRRMIVSSALATSLVATLTRRVKMAYSTLITLPVVALFIAFQRSFVNSIASSGVKG